MVLIVVTSAHFARDTLNSEQDLWLHVPLNSEQNYRLTKVCTNHLFNHSRIVSVSFTNFT